MIVVVFLPVPHTVGFIVGLDVLQLTLLEIWTFLLGPSLEIDMVQTVLMYLGALS